MRTLTIALAALFLLGLPIGALGQNSYREEIIRHAI